MSRSGISTISGITALGALLRLTDPSQRPKSATLAVALDAALARLVLAVALDALARLDHPRGRTRVWRARAQGSRPISSLWGIVESLHPQYCLGERVFLKGTLKVCILTGIISGIISAIISAGSFTMATTWPVCMIMTTGRTLLS